MIESSSLAVRMPPSSWRSAFNTKVTVTYQVTVTLYPYAILGWPFSSIRSVTCPARGQVYACPAADPPKGLSGPRGALQGIIAPMANMNFDLRLQSLYAVPGWAGI